MGDGILKNIKDLTEQERLDILARVYLLDCVKPINKRINGAICRIDYYNAALLNGQVKNQFLCGTGDIRDAGYAIGNNGKYELDHMSVVGAYFNLMYRTAVLENLDNDYNVARASMYAYSYVREAGYQPFWLYYNGAWRETMPTSVKGISRYYGVEKEERLALSEVRKRNICSLNEFAQVKQYIMTSMSKYMKSMGCDEGTMVSVLSDIKGLPVPEIKVKSSTKVAPAKKVPAGTIMSLPQEDKSMIDNVPDEEQQLLEELDSISKPSGRIIPTDMVDEYGTALGVNDRGDYCYADGAKFNGKVTYWQDGGIADDIEAGVIYDNPDLSTKFEDEDVYDEDGYMMTDGGQAISIENGFTDTDVEETRKSKPKEYNE